MAIPPWKHRFSFDHGSQSTVDVVRLGWVTALGTFVWARWLKLLLDFTTLFNILGHQRRYRHRAWKVRQILLRGSGKNPSTPAGIEPAKLGSRGEYDNHWTSGVDGNSSGKKLGYELYVPDSIPGGGAWLFFVTMLCPDWPRSPISLL